MDTVNVLLKKGIITQELIADAKREAQRTGISVDKAIVKLGFISEEDIAKTMADEMGVPYVDLSGYIIDPDVIRIVPEDMARRFKIIPIFKIGNSLTIAMENPLDIMALDEVRKKTGFSIVEPVFSMGHNIETAIAHYYGGTGTVEELIKGIPKPKSVSEELGEEKLAELATEVPVIKLVNLIITQAVVEKASDIHVEPQEDDIMVRFRLDGILHEVSILPKHLQSAIASRIKVLSKMDIAEKRKPQDGRFIVNVHNKDIDLRVSTFPTVYGENVVLRLLDKSSAIMGLSELGMPNDDLTRYDGLIRRPYGIILATGPTGSGKTTTLYASLSAINSIEKNIITIEDPVEYEIPLIRQTQVNPKAGLTFANGLRSILRQDPDIIMVGEIRDRETAEIAIQAALTGHLVFSTLHTNDAAGALTRLIDMDIEPFLISSTVIGVLTQRLVRTICKECKESYEPPFEILERLKIGENINFYKGKGCKKCRGTGYSGRIGIFELLVMDDMLKKMVVGKASSSEIKKTAIESGMNSIYQNGLKKIIEGVTTVEEVLRVIEE